MRGKKVRAIRDMAYRLLVKRAHENGVSLNHGPPRGMRVKHRVERITLTDVIGSTGRYTYKSRINQTLEYEQITLRRIYQDLKRDVKRKGFDVVIRDALIEVTNGMAALTTERPLTVRPEHAARS